MEKDYISTLLRSNNTVFTFKDLSLIWNETDVKLTKKRVYRYTKMGKLYSIRKGIYAKARAGLIKGFTGIDDPYEVPENPDVRVDTTDINPDEAAQEVLLELQRQGYLK